MDSNTTVPGCLAQHQLQLRRSRSLLSPAAAAGLFKRLALDRLLVGHRGCVNHVQWNESGTLLASGSDDTHICLWDLQSSAPLVSHATGHTANIFCVKFLPGTDSSSQPLLASCAGDAEVRLHDVITGAVVKVYTPHTGRVKKLVTEANNPNLLISCSEDGSVRQLDLRSSRQGSQLLQLSRNGMRLEINSISAPWHKPWLLAVGASDDALRVYDRRMPACGGGGGGGGAGSSSTRGTACKALCHLSPAGKAPQFASDCISGVAFADDGQQVLANYLGDYVYLWSLPGSNTARSTAADAAGGSVGGSKRSRGALGAAQEGEQEQAAAPSSPLQPPLKTRSRRSSADGAGYDHLPAAAAESDAVHAGGISAGAAAATAGAESPSDSEPGAGAGAEGSPAGQQRVLSVDDAVQRLERGDLAIAPRRRGAVASAVLHRSQDLFESGEVDASLRYALVALRLRPNYGMAHYQAAVCYERLGLLREALSEAERALDMAWGYDLQQFVRRIRRRLSDDNAAAADGAAAAAAGGGATAAEAAAALGRGRLSSRQHGLAQGPESPPVAAAVTDTLPAAAAAAVASGGSQAQRAQPGAGVSSAGAGDFAAAVAAASGSSRSWSPDSQASSGSSGSRRQQRPDSSGGAEQPQSRESGSVLLSDDVLTDMQDEEGESGRSDSGGSSSGSSGSSETTEGSSSSSDEQEEQEGSEGSAGGLQQDEGSEDSSDWLDDDDSAAMLGLDEFKCYYDWGGTGTTAAAAAYEQYQLQQQQQQQQPAASSSSSAHRQQQRDGVTNNNSSSSSSVRQLDAEAFDNLVTPLRNQLLLLQARREERLPRHFARRLCMYRKRYETMLLSLQHQVALRQAVERAVAGGDEQGSAGSGSSSRDPAGSSEGVGHILALLREHEQRRTSLQEQHRQARRQQQQHDHLFGLHRQQIEQERQAELADNLSSLQQQRTAELLRRQGTSEQQALLQPHLMRQAVIDQAGEDQQEQQQQPRMIGPQPWERVPRRQALQPLPPPPLPQQQQSQQSQRFGATAGPSCQPQQQAAWLNEQVWQLDGYDRQLHKYGARFIRAAGRLGQQVKHQASRLLQHTSAASGGQQAAGEGSGALRVQLRNAELLQLGLQHSLNMLQADEVWVDMARPIAEAKAGRQQQQQQQQEQQGQQQQGPGSMQPSPSLQAQLPEQQQQRSSARRWQQSAAGATSAAAAAVHAAMLPEFEAVKGVMQELTGLLTALLAEAAEHVQQARNALAQHTRQGQRQRECRAGCGSAPANAAAAGGSASGAVSQGSDDGSDSSSDMGSDGSDGCAADGGRRSRSSSPSSNGLSHLLFDGEEDQPPLLPQDLLQEDDPVLLELGCLLAAGDPLCEAAAVDPNSSSSNSRRHQASGGGRTQRSALLQDAQTPAAAAKAGVGAADVGAAAAEVQGGSCNKQQQQLHAPGRWQPPGGGSRQQHWACRYRGHVSLKTVKDVAFVGPQQSMVAAGSDDGRMFVWDRHTGVLITALRGDRYVVNCIDSHPSLLLLACCGIDATVKLWSPCLTHPRALGAELLRSLAYNEVERAALGDCNMLNPGSRYSDRFRAFSRQQAGVMVQRLRREAASGAGGQ